MLADAFSADVATDEAFCWAAKMFLAVTQLPCTWTLGSAANMPGMAMADAWAAGSQAGIGGWWTWKNTVDPAEIYWFHLPITMKDFPAHWHCDGTDLSKIIATLELLAQLILLKLSLIHI